MVVTYCVLLCDVSIRVCIEMLSVIMCSYVIDCVNACEYQNSLAAEATDES